MSVFYINILLPLLSFLRQCWSAGPWHHFQMFWMHIMFSMTACRWDWFCYEQWTKRNISCVLKYVPHPTITRTFSRWCYRLAINNRHHFSTRTWKDKPDGGNCSDKHVFRMSLSWLSLHCVAGDHTHMLLLEGVILHGMCFLIVCQTRQTKRFEMTTHSSNM